MNGTRTCSVEECSAPVQAKGFCWSHWRYNKLYGDPNARFPKTPDRDRFLAKIDRSGECWLWTGELDPHGYGRFSYKGGKGFAHRASWQFFVGPLPDHLAIDHLCRVRNCVNPAHLEPVTHGENTIRATRIRVINHPACVHGHEFTPENTFIRADGARGCRICRRLRGWAWEHGMTYAEYRDRFPVS